MSQVVWDAGRLADYLGKVVLNRKGQRFVPANICSGGVQPLYVMDIKVPGVYKHSLRKILDKCFVAGGKMLEEKWKISSRRTVRYRKDNSFGGKRDLEPENILESRLKVKKAQDWYI